MKILIKFAVVVIFFNLSSSLWSANQANQFWISAELLNWQVKSSPINIPLVTGNTNPGAFAFINEPGTFILFGRGSNQDEVHFSKLTGGRLVVGAWLDDASRHGLEISGFDLPRNKQTFSTTPYVGIFPVINVPFNSGKENVLVNKETPNQVVITNSIQSYGYEINYLSALVAKVRGFASFYTGFRFLHFQEDFHLVDRSFPAIGVVVVQDRFMAKNNFYGLQFGAKTQLSVQHLLVNLSLGLAAGENYQGLRIKGATELNNQRLQNFGLFSEPSNLGAHKTNEFALIPELNVKLGYGLTPQINPFFTYNLLYLNHVLRPLKNIDRNINTSQNPLIGGTGILQGPPAPLAQLNNTNSWLQGASVGFELKV